MVKVACLEVVRVFRKPVAIREIVHFAQVVERIHDGCIKVVASIRFETSVITIRISSFRRFESIMSVNRAIRIAVITPKTDFRLGADTNREVDCSQC